MLHLVNSTIFWLYTHAGVNSTFTTGGEIRKTVCHIDPQRVYVHTREQLTKWLIGGYLRFRLLNKPLTWNIAIYWYGIEPMMSEDRGYQFIFYWASHCKSPWWHWCRVLALFWRSRSDWQVKSHPRQQFCSSGYQVTSVMFLINRLHIIACCPWLPLLRGGLCRSTEYSWKLQCPVNCCWLLQTIITSRRNAYCCIYHNTSNGDKIVMKCVAFFMLILYIFSHEIYGDNGRIYQIIIYMKMLTPNYGFVGATDKFTCSDTVSVLYLSCFSFSWQSYNYFIVLFTFW